jgi:uncharacterized CHY-type Zn-finger protein
MEVKLHNLGDTAETNSINDKMTALPMRTKSKPQKKNSRAAETLLNVKVRFLVPCFVGNKKIRCAEYGRNDKVLSIRTAHVRQMAVLFRTEQSVVRHPFTVTQLARHMLRKRILAMQLGRLDLLRRQLAMLKENARVFVEQLKPSKTQFCIAFCY